MPDIDASDLGRRPAWITFDCYGTLVQWHESLGATLARSLSARGAADRLPEFTAAYRRHEAALEDEEPHRRFRDVVRGAFLGALSELGLPAGEAGDADAVVEAISAVPPFPEVPAALDRLRAAGFRLCIVSNTDRDIIAGTLELLGPGRIDRVVTAEEAGAYKPSPRIFERAWSEIGVGREETVHVAAGVRVDLAAARDLGFRTVWVDRGAGEAPLPGYRPDLTAASLDGVVERFAAMGWLEA